MDKDLSKELERWQSYVKDLNQINNVLKDMRMSSDEIIAWYLKPNQAFDEKSPIDLMANDVGAKRVLSHLITLAQGNVGG